MRYSLGDDKESFDCYNETIEILNKIGDSLLSKGWIFDKENYVFKKDNRVLKLESNQDHVTTLCLSDKSIDYNKLCNNNNRYEIIVDYDDSIYGVCFDVSKNTNISEIVRDIENAPLKNINKEIEL